MKILGIETSCDESAAAVVEDGQKLLANVVASQADLHARYGGVVPEVASRQHLRSIVPTVDAAMEEAGCGWADLDAIAVTIGPGLAGSLLVGANFAKAMAYSRGLPFVAVNHLEGHIYANWLTGEVPRLPALCLIVSGGHTDMVVMEDHGNYRRIGNTVDDAAGEAFDKVARLMKLGFPGGPAIQEKARESTNGSLRLPRAKLRTPYDFSFSGLKTKVSRLVEGKEGEAPPTAELAAAFQDAVVDALVVKTLRATEEFSVREILLSGGVAANLLLRQTLAERSSLPVRVPPVPLCTDNAAMIGSCAFYQMQQGCDASLGYDIQPGLRIG